jgi:hypothetical protein
MTVAMVVAVAAGELGAHVGDVLDRVGGVLGDEARAAIAMATARATAQTTRAAAVAAWRAPVPPDVRHIHPSWIEAAPASTGAAGVWALRGRFAELPAVGERRDVLGWLVAIGADQLAFALGDVAAQAPSPLVRDAAVRIARPPRAGRLGSRRAAIARCRLAADDDDLGLARIGARAVAPHLADDALGRRALVVALPRPTGLAIAEELRAHAADPVADAPARDTLAWPRW